MGRGGWGGGGGGRSWRGWFTAVEGKKEGGGQTSPRTQGDRRHPGHWLRELVGGPVRWCAFSLSLTQLIPICFPYNICITVPTLTELGLARHPLPSATRAKYEKEWDNYLTLADPPAPPTGPGTTSTEWMSSIYRGVVPARNILKRDFAINGAAVRTPTPLSLLPFLHAVVFSKELSKLTKPTNLIPAPHLPSLAFF